MSSMLFLMFVGAMVSAFVAQSKGRNAVGWLLFGALLPVIGMVAILCLPALPPPETTTEATPTST